MLNRMQVMKKRSFVRLFVLVTFVVCVSGSHEKFFYNVKDYKQKWQTVSEKLGPHRDCTDPNNIYLPPTATNTSQRLLDLRKEMATSSYDAYIVPSSDAHLSEYVALSDKRRQWITGFTGSAGTAVVTHDKAALWTDGRYFEQAEQQLDCNWILMKSDELDVPTIEEWLATELSAGSLVGANPFLFSIETWIGYSDNISPSSISMNESIPDLIDLVWDDRPSSVGGGVAIQPISYAGVAWTAKLLNARTEMQSNDADFLLLTILDEIAWFFNMRGKDIPYTPVFTSYAIVPRDSHVVLYSNMSQFDNEEIQNHLNNSDCIAKHSCVVVKPYEQARLDLMQFSSDPTSMVWLPSDGTTYGMYSVVNTNQQISSDSPLKVPKAVKNPSEIAGMREAHTYDAIALCEYLQWLEVNVPLGIVDEINGAEVLKSFRLSQNTNRGLSFGSISASGPNGAVIHYGSKPETNRNLTTNEMYLIDSGGQYLGGTTDVTRTVHIGSPSAFQKETFTRALMGMIDVQKAIFPYTKDGNELDFLARRYLYEVGLEYRHGTGHGVGQYLSIHEYPPGIGTSLAEGYALQLGMFTSVEPGYYEDGLFGLRHENVNVVVPATTENNFGGYEFYTFDPVTLVPFQLKMINFTLMSDDQIQYLNQYHNKVRQIVGLEAEMQGKYDLKQWIDSATVPIVKEGGCSSSNHYQSASLSVLILVCLQSVISHSLY